jgi:hypothetical protein
MTVALSCSGYQFRCLTDCEVGALLDLRLMGGNLTQLDVHERGFTPKERQ